MGGEFATEVLVEARGVGAEVVAVLTEQTGEVLLVLRQAVAVIVVVVVVEVGGVRAKDGAVGDHLAVAVFPTIGHPIAIGIDVRGVAPAALDGGVGGRIGVGAVALLAIPDTVEVGIGVPGVGGEDLIDPGGVILRGALEGVRPLISQRIANQVAGAALELLGSGEAICVNINGTVISSLGNDIGAQANIGFPAVRATVAIGICTLRVNVVAALDVVVELLTVREGNGIYCVTESRELVIDIACGMQNRIGPSGAEVEAEGLVDLEVTDDARLAGDFGHEGVGVRPGGHIVLAIGPGDGLLVGGQGHIRGVSRGIAQQVEAIALVVIVVDRRGEGRIGIRIGRGTRGGRIVRVNRSGRGHRGLEEVVEGGVGLDDGPGEEVVIRVAVSVVLAVEVEGIEVGTNFPTIEHPVVIGIAVDGIGADGELFGGDEAVVIRVSCSAGGIGIEGR